MDNCCDNHKSFENKEVVAKNKITAITYITGIFMVMITALQKGVF